MSPRLRILLLLSPLLAAACKDETRTARVFEPYTVVPGTPQVDTAAPKVLTDDTREPHTTSLRTPTATSTGLRRAPAGACGRLLSTCWAGK